MIQMLRTPVILLVLMLIAFNAEAQIVSIRTTPVSVGEQFSVYPSELMGMGGGLALQDLELDPFANPATGARIRGILLAGSPTLYSIPDERGFGRTLPVTAFVGLSNTFVGGSVAVQELESAFAQRFTPTPGVTSSDRFAHNAYAWGMIGKRWPEQRLSVGFSGSYASLDKVHAVDLLYPQSESIEQGGHINDLRVGLLKEFSDDRYLEAVLVRNKVDMSHTVTYVDRIWLPAERTFGTSAPRREHNLDRTTTWGAHTSYVGAMSDTRWRWGTSLTANVKSHPKIPNYEFMSVPRDPGNSYAFSFAIGVAKQDSISRLALDFAYEPVWTNTWAEAAEPIATERGVTIPKGGMTIENEFVFSNYMLHVGWSRRWMQLGLGWRNVQYFLNQYNAITDLSREQDENWVEVTPTWGLTFRLSSLELRYFGKLRWALSELPTPATDAAPAPGPDIVAAPSGPLADAIAVISQQLSVSIPIGGKRSNVASR